MALLASYYEDEYLPDHPLLVVRGRGAPIGRRDEPEDHGRLTEHFSDAGPTATFARSGADWLMANSDKDWHAVTLESHDAPPPLFDVPDVMETGYRHSSAGLALDTLISEAEEPHLALSVGRYRVRISRWTNARGLNWTLQFWPAAGGDLILRRVRRSERFDDCDVVPADGEPGFSTFRRLSADLVLVAAWTGGAALTIDDLSARLLVPAARLRATLRGAAERGYLALEGNLTAAHASVTVTALPGREFLRAAEEAARSRAVRERVRRHAQERADSPSGARRAPVDAPADGQRALRAVAGLSRPPRSDVAALPVGGHRPQGWSRPTGGCSFHCPAASRWWRGWTRPNGDARGRARTERCCCRPAVPYWCVWTAGSLPSSGRTPVTARCRRTVDISS